MAVKRPRWGGCKTRKQRCNASERNRSGALRLRLGNFRMNSDNIHIHGRSSERGTALVEFAIMAPFLVFFLTMLIRMGFIMEQYLHVVNISRDAARQAVQIVNHEANQSCVVTETSTAGCPITNGFVPHVRAWYLLSEFAPDLDLSTVNTNSLLTMDGSGTGSDQTVRFQISGDFLGIGSIPVPISVQATGGYRVIGAGGGGGGGKGGGGLGYGRDGINEIKDDWGDGVYMDDMYVLKGADQQAQGASKQVVETVVVMTP